MGAEYSETLNDRDIGGQLLPLDSLGNSNTNNQVGEWVIYLDYNFTYYIFSISISILNIFFD